MVVKCKDEYTLCKACINDLFKELSLVTRIGKTPALKISSKSGRANESLDFLKTPKSKKSKSSLKHLKEYRTFLISVIPAPSHVIKARGKLCQEGNSNPAA
jgi:hypothetical protein